MLHLDLGLGSAPPPAFLPALNQPKFMSQRQTWICDSCGKTIEYAEDGWVEWLVRQEGERYVGHGLHLVHQHPAPGLPDCRYQMEVFRHEAFVIHDVDLLECVGADGLVELLSMIAGEVVPTSELVEMIQRLHVPGYEYARSYFEAAIEAGVIEPSNRAGFFLTKDINAVNAWRVQQPGQEGG